MWQTQVFRVNIFFYCGAHFTVKTLMFIIPWWITAHANACFTTFQHVNKTGDCKLWQMKTFPSTFRPNSGHVLPCRESPFYQRIIYFFFSFRWPAQISVVLSNSSRNTKALLQLRSASHRIVKYSHKVERVERATVGLLSFDFCVCLLLHIHVEVT